MSLMEPVPLGDVHSELSCILYAARQELRDVGGMLGFDLRYSESTYLSLVIEFWGSASEKKRICEILVLRLQRGLIFGEHDYRFRGISHSTNFTDHIEPHYLSASLDLGHWPHRRPYGWEPPLKPSECSSSSRRAAPQPTPRAAAGPAV
jgi:hypothetical protein